CRVSFAGFGVWNIAINSVGTRNELGSVSDGSAASDFRWKHYFADQRPIHLAAADAARAVLHQSTRLTDRSALHDRPRREHTDRSQQYGGLSRRDAAAVGSNPNGADVVWPIAAGMCAGLSDASFAVVRRCRWNLFHPRCAGRQPTDRFIGHERGD